MRNPPCQEKKGGEKEREAMSPDRYVTCDALHPVAAFPNFASRFGFIINTFVLFFLDYEHAAIGVAVLALLTVYLIFRGAATSTSFWTISHAFLSSKSPRAVACTRLGAHHHGLLTGACNLMPD